MTEDFEKMGSVDEIMAWFRVNLEKKITLDSNTWLRGAQALNVQLEKEQTELFKREQVVAKLRLQFLNGQDKINVSEAKMRVDASDEYKLAKEQKAKVDRALELIRIAKKQASLSTDLYHSNF